MPYSMTAVQAADRLGVKQATLYAYVSRGVLGRAKAADGRGSLFDPDEVERLALRGRPRRPAGAVGRRGSAGRRLLANARRTVAPFGALALAARQGDGDRRQNA